MGLQQRHFIRGSCRRHFVGQVRRSFFKLKYTLAKRLVRVRKITERNIRFAKSLGI